MYEITYKQKIGVFTVIVNADNLAAAMQFVRDSEPLWAIEILSHTRLSRGTVVFIK